MTVLIYLLCSFVGALAMLGGAVCVKVIAMGLELRRAVKRERKTLYEGKAPIRYREAPPEQPTQYARCPDIDCSICDRRASMGMIRGEDPQQEPAWDTDEPEIEPCGEYDNACPVCSPLEDGRPK